MVKSPKSRVIRLVVSTQWEERSTTFFSLTSPLNKTKSGKISPKTYRNPWKSDTWKTMGSLPFFKWPPFFGGLFLGNDSMRRFQDRPSQRLQCSSFPFLGHFEGSKLKASRNISSLLMFVFEVFVLQKKSWNFRPIFSQFDLPPLQSFYQHSFASPQKNHVNRVFFGITPQLQQECSNWSPRWKIPHRPTREILELCRRSRIVPWSRRSSRSKWMWFPVAPCDHWRGMEKPIGGPQR